MLTIKDVLESMALSDKEPIVIENRDGVRFFSGSIADLNDLLDKDYDKQKEILKNSFNVDINKPLNSLGVLQGERPMETNNATCKFKPLKITLAR